MTQPFHPIFGPPEPNSTDPVLSPATLHSLHQVFQQMDGDGDGRLNVDDVWEALMAAGEKVELDEAEAMVAAIDSTSKQAGKKSQVRAINRADFIRVTTR